MFKKFKIAVIVLLFMLISIPALGQTYILEGSILISGRSGLVQQVDQVTVGQNYRIGARLQINEKVYYYSKIGINTGIGLDIEAGLGVVSLDTITYVPTLSPSSGLSIAGGDSNSRTLYVNIPVSQENEFQYGTLVLIDSSNSSKSWSTTIASNDTNITGQDTVLMRLEDDLPVAVLSSDALIIFPNPYRNVAPSADSSFSSIIGVCNFFNGHGGSLTDYEGYYTWIQTWGPCAIKLDPRHLTGGANREREVYNFGGGLFAGSDSLGTAGLAGATGSYHDSTIFTQPRQIVGTFLARNREGEDFDNNSLIMLQISP